MVNLKLVEDQPHWRVRIVALFAKLMGVLIHVEGIPFGSSRVWKSAQKAKGAMGEAGPLSAGGAHVSLHK